MSFAKIDFITCFNKFGTTDGASFGSGTGEGVGFGMAATGNGVVFWAGFDIGLGNGVCCGTILVVGGVDSGAVGEAAISGGMVVVFCVKELVEGACFGGGVENTMQELVFGGLFGKIGGGTRPKTGGGGTFGGGVATRVGGTGGAVAETGGGSVEDWASHAVRIEQSSFIMVCN
ncbi:glycine-rich cell wall structural protein 1-like [Helianthus annuus]|uniref:glycine-rich cell wall structural protein 1-like n=1 Tax=Helianthus annuus TaxID=4232 RepID=UPI000B90603B|nr:glycine-rich cell wall structural protein 1-like [Helianthus annuus]